jgi:S-adenosylmethionine decarboxylase
MAYDDALFQLGMDLTRSSTAQKEDSFETAPASGERYDSRKSIILDLIGAKRLASAKTVEQAIKSAFEFAKAGPGTIRIERTTSGRSMTGTATLAAGRVEIEAWPATGYVAVDIVGSALRPEIAMTALVDAFAAREVIVRRERPASLAQRLSRPAAGTVSEPVTLSTRRAAPKSSKAARAA